MLSYRKATEKDVDLFFSWANDSAARSNSYNRDLISYQTHIEWFSKRINSPEFVFLVFSQESLPVGQIRFEVFGSNQAIISVMVDPNHRGKGYATEMISKASEYFLKTHNGFKIEAYTFKENKASLNAFRKAGYILSEEKEINKILSCILYKV